MSWNDSETPHRILKTWKDRGHIMKVIKNGNEKNEFKDFTVEDWFKIDGIQYHVCFRNKDGKIQSYLNGIENRKDPVEKACKMYEQFKSTEVKSHTFIIEMADAMYEAIQHQTKEIKRLGEAIDTIQKFNRDNY
jgi:hypothetical protein